MTKEQEEIFIKACYDFSLRYKSCFCKDTGEKYPKTFAKFRYWRFVDELEFRNNIKIKPTDVKTYDTYEKIMVQEINKFIDECKQQQSKKDKENAKNKQIKRKKD